MAKTSKSPTSDSLFNELKRLAKRANQRILRLERLTGSTGTFDVKQLYDYLDTEKLQAVTAKGRVATRKSFTNEQKENIIKALEDFLSGESTTSKAKKIMQKYEEESGVKLNWSQVNSLYQTSKYSDIVKKYYDSGFWDLARECVKENWTYEKFEDTLLANTNAKYVDEVIKEDLIGLYDYIQDIKYGD